MDFISSGLIFEFKQQVAVNNEILEYKIEGNLNTCQLIQFLLEVMWSYFVEAMP